MMAGALLYPTRPRTLSSKCGYSAASELQVQSFNFNFKLTFKATDASTTQQTLFSEEEGRVIRQLTSRVSATAANLNDSDSSRTSRHQRLCVIRDRP